MLLIMILPLIIALIFVMKKKIGLYISTLTCCISVLVGILIFMAVVYAQTGMDILTYYADVADQILSQDEQSARALYFIQTMDAQAFDIEFETVKLSLIRLFTYVVPVYFVCGCLFGGFCSYLIVRAIAKKTGAQVARIPEFSRFYLPRHFGKLTFAGYAIALIGNMNGWHNFDIVYIVIAAILGCVYYVQGMCLVDFGLKRKLKYPALRVLIYVVVSLFIWQAFAFVGAFEQILKIRRRVEKREQA